MCILTQEHLGTLLQGGVPRHANGPVRRRQATEGKSSGRSCPGTALWQVVVRPQMKDSDPCRLSARAWDLFQGAGYQESVEECKWGLEVVHVDAGGSLELS